jgi:hypothetical protein
VHLVGDSGFEPVAAADGGDHQVQRGVLGVPAFFDQIFGGLVRGSDLDELRFWGVVFAEVGANATLSLVYVLHHCSPFVNAG